ncbi:helix-turn-helix transcriptional regulator [Salinigranum sp.]|uniref:helix-turn-helix transcriptional regulator n=1 Tax=Salinigranum sp. TaxID=1966351 RepID=UPI003566315B
MCRLRRVGVSLLVAFVVASSVTAPAGATDHEAPVPGAAQLGDAGIEPDGVLLRADVRENGDARWTVEYRVRLNDENTTAAFGSLREDIKANESAYTSTFADRMRATARAAENTTGREMRIENVSVSATRQQLPQEYGVVTYQFDWRGFAVADGQTLRAGDALAGLFLDRQTTLVLSWPDAYATTAVQPSPDERRENAAVWVGPTDFGDGEPAVSLSTAATETGGVGGNGGDGADDGAGRDGTGGGSSLLSVVGGAVLLAVAAGAVVLWRRSQRDERAVGSTDAEAPRAGDDVSDAAATTTATAAADTDGAEGADTEEVDVATADDESPDPWEDELLSNEERVLALLEHNDGRMKQQAVAAELDWSDAKTSQVIGKLRDADEIETFRIGRENVVSLPGSGLS